MRIGMISIVAATAALGAGCGVQPGSAEWCKGVIQGTIQASEAELEANGEKCKAVMMDAVKDALGGMMPNQ